MGERTPRFDFSTLGPGDALQDDSFKFSNQDIQLLDRLLQYGLADHHHTAQPAGAGDPSLPLTTSQANSGGTIPAGIRYYYQYTYVDANDSETAAAPAVFVETAPPVGDPGAPALVWDPAGGILPPGSYTYVLSAYKSATTLETRAANPAYKLLNGSTTTSSITLTMPSLPSGATGWNIYRKKPGSPRFYFLAQTTGSSYVDDGTVSEDPTRSIPTANTTNSDNVIHLTLPGATPSLPAPFVSWKIYRTDVVDNWSASLLHHVVEETSPGSGVIQATYEDIGQATILGTPPSKSQRFGSPPKVTLTDASDVQGFLPPGRNVVPTVLATFTVSGLVSVTPGTFIWVCPYDEAQIAFVRAYLGVNAAPTAQPVIVDVNKYYASMATPGWTTIFTNQANRPKVLVGDWLGATTVPNILSLVAGDALSVDVDQAGGGATPGDYNLVVDIVGYAKSGSETTSYVWTTP